MCTCCEGIVDRLLSYAAWDGSTRSATKSVSTTAQEVDSRAGSVFYRVVKSGRDDQGQTSHSTWVLVPLYYVPVAATAAIAHSTTRPAMRP